MTEKRISVHEFPLSKREVFAAFALLGLLSPPSGGRENQNPFRHEPGFAAKMAYTYADEMIEHPESYHGDGK